MHAHAHACTHTHAAFKTCWALNKVCSLVNSILLDPSLDFDNVLVTLGESWMMGMWQRSPLFCKFFRVFNYFKVESLKKKKKEAEMLTGVTENVPAPRAAPNPEILAPGWVGPSVFVTKQEAWAEQLLVPKSLYTYFVVSLGKKVPRSRIAVCKHRFDALVTSCQIALQKNFNGYSHPQCMRGLASSSLAQIGF